MNLKCCMEIGKDCGLTTIEECYDNIYNNASMIFQYRNIDKEIEELQRDIFYHDPDLFCELFVSDKNELLKRGWKVKDDNIKDDEIFENLKKLVYHQNDSNKQMNETTSVQHEFDYKNLEKMSSQTN